MYPEVVVTSTICSEEVLFSQHLRGLKPETPVSWQLCRQSMSKITLSRGSPGPHLQDDPPKTLLWCSWLLVLISKEESSLGQEGEQKCPVLLQHCFPGTRDKTYTSPLWDTHIVLKATLPVGFFYPIYLWLAIQILLPVHCSSIALICSSLNFQNTASFFHSWGFKWLYARFQREERICLVCVLWSCLKDTLKSDPLPLWASCVWKRM